MEVVLVPQKHVKRALMLTISNGDVLTLIHMLLMTRKVLLPVVQEMAKLLDILPHFVLNY
jgi:hypothetical protein